VASLLQVAPLSVDSNTPVNVAASNTSSPPAPVGWIANAVTYSQSALPAGLVDGSWFQVLPPSFDFKIPNGE
jgi:hypothetical protein